MQRKPEEFDVAAFTAAELVLAQKVIALVRPLANSNAIPAEPAGLDEAPTEAELTELAAQLVDYALNEFEGGQKRRNTAIPCIAANIAFQARSAQAGRTVAQIIVDRLKADSRVEARMKAFLESTGLDAHDWQHRLDILATGNYTAAFGTTGRNRISVADCTHGFVDGFKRFLKYRPGLSAILRKRLLAIATLMAGAFAAGCGTIGAGVVDAGSATLAKSAARTIAKSHTWRAAHFFWLLLTFSTLSLGWYVFYEDGQNKKDERGERRNKDVRPLPPLVVTNSSAPGSQPSQPKESTRTLPVRRRVRGLDACDLESLAEEVLGPEAVDCGKIGIDIPPSDAATAQECAVSAYRSGREFLLIAQRQGIDSLVADAFVARHVGNGLNIEQYRRDSDPSGGRQVGASVRRTTCLVYPSSTADSAFQETCLRPDFCINCQNGISEQICAYGERI